MLCILGDSGSGAICQYCGQSINTMDSDTEASSTQRACIDVLCGINSAGKNGMDCLVDKDGNLYNSPPPAVFTKVSVFPTWINSMLRTEFKVNDIAMDMLTVTMAQTRIIVPLLIRQKK